MRTNLLSGPAQSLAWLEREAPGQEPERIELARLPFTVGRNESCDYQICSSRVSREHAEFVRQGTTFLVRDLKSTNGTFVNGQKIEEHRLAGGDLVVIADVQFSFRTSRDEAGRKTITQVMCQHQADNGEDNTAHDLIHVIRAAQEALLYRATRNRFQSIVDLSGNRCVGYEAIPRLHVGESPLVLEVLEATDCRLTERTASLRRLLAAEHVARLPEARLLFVKLQSAEVGADKLPRALERLSHLAGGKEIVAQIPDSAVIDIPYFRDFRAKLRERGIGVAFDGFTGSPHQIKGQAEFAPDYLKLSPALTRGADKCTQRQEQIKALAGAARELNIQIIAVGVHTDGEARTCQELGCHLAQGDHFGHAQTIDWPLENAALGA